MKTFSMDEGLPILRATPGALAAWIERLPDTWITATEGPDTWSPFDVVGHLIHGELTDWMPRIELLLAHGESRPFTPFDRFAQFRDSQGKSLSELLENFAQLRQGNLERLESLDLKPVDFSRRGRHPELGTITLGQLLATWVVHDLNHVAQIARVMARRYTDTVGPWLEYLPLLSAR
jgi:uncharacterized damage-inducible protein DinB